MSTRQIEHPRVVSRDEWLAARKELLAKEKSFNRERDALSAQRRELPWVRVSKQYAFDAPGGRETLAETRNFYLGCLVGGVLLAAYGLHRIRQWVRPAPGNTELPNHDGQPAGAGEPTAPVVPPGSKIITIIDGTSGKRHDVVIPGSP